MRKSIFTQCTGFSMIIGLFLNFAVSNSLVGQTKFQRIYSLGTSNVTFAGAQIAPDGGYIMAVTYSSDVYLIKTDSIGTMQWTQRYDLGANESVYGIEVGENGYMVVGWTMGTGTNSRDGFILYTDFMGAMLNVFRVDQSNTGNAFHSVRRTSDLGFILSGRSAVGPGSSYLMYLTKTAPNGSVQWAKPYGGTGWDWSYWAEQTADGGYIMLGEADGFGAGGPDAYLVKTDSAGNKQWSKTYGSTNAEQAFCVKPLPGGGYLLAGRTLGWVPGNTDPKGFLIRTDSNGNPVWLKIYQELFEVFHVSLTPDGGFIFVGPCANVPGASFGSNDLYVVKADSSGNPQWAKVYGSTGGEGPAYVLPTQDGGYLISGFAGGFGSAALKPYLIKTDATGSSGCNEMSHTPAVYTNTPTVTTPSDVTVPGFVQYIPLAAAFAATPTLNVLCCNSPPATSFTTTQTGTFSYSFTNTTPGTNSYLWSFGDGNVSGALSPSHTYAGPGTFDVCLMATNSCTTAIVCTTLTIVATGTDAIKGYSRFTAYPNPASNQFWLADHEKKDEKRKIQLINVSGITVMEKEINNFGPEIAIDISKLDTGIYILVTDSGGLKDHQRLVIIREGK